LKDGSEANLIPIPIVEAELDATDRESLIPNGNEAHPVAAQAVPYNAFSHDIPVAEPAEHLPLISNRRVIIDDDDDENWIV